MNIICVTCWVLCTTFSIVKSFDNENIGNTTEKRVPAPIIGGLLVAGASLVGTSVSGLKSGSYSVSVSGSIENYSKYGLRLEECEEVDGSINVPIRSVSPGYIEGFASHKTSGAALGSYVHCSFTMKDLMFHMMYSAPYSFDNNINKLGFAICPKSNEECQNINADKIYANKTDFAKVGDFYDVYEPLKLCYQGYCLHGVMGTSHKTNIEIELYPESFEDLTDAVKSSSAKQRWKPEDYESFIADTD